MEKKYILIVEDEEAYGKILQNKLEAHNFDVVWVKNGNNAIETLSQRKPDLILLDLIMPVKSGFETLGEIKSTPANASIPVVVMSNLGQEEDISKAKKLGATDYLVKSDVSLQSVIDMAVHMLAAPQTA